MDRRSPGRAPAATHRAYAASIAVLPLRNATSCWAVNTRLLALTEDVLKEEPEPGGRLLFREDFPYQCEDIGNGVQVKHLYEVPDILCVAGPRGKCLHRKQMFRRGSEDTKAGMVEHPGR